VKLEKLKARGFEYLFRDPESQIVYFRRYTKRTGQVFKSLRTRDLTEAKKLRDTLIRELDPKKTKQVYLALELFDQWIESKKIAGASEGTLTSIRSSRNYLAPYLDTMTVDEITSAWWMTTYVKEVRVQTHSKRKFFNDKKWLVNFLKSQVEAETITKMPKLVNPDRKSEVGKVFTDEEVSTLLNFAQNEDLRLALLMALTMGMRRLEIFHLKCARVDLKKRSIKLKEEDTKIRKARSFAISAACWPLIQARCKPGSIWVFPSHLDPAKPLHRDGFKTAWTNLRRTTGITGRFHDLRHTFLTKAFKTKGANSALICDYAGLSLEVAQKVYLHFNESDTAEVAGLVSYE
jgi:integrase